ncbi:MAG: glutamate mutase L, partial [Desulfocurvibacter africanus]
MVYAGNSALRKPVSQIFKVADIEFMLADNVFPEVDVLNIQPLRRLIHEVFNRHIIHAPGMSGLAELTTKEILPTPGAVLHASELLAE